MNNRHDIPLPTKPCLIRIKYTDRTGKTSIILCAWFPRNPKKFVTHIYQPSDLDNYIGTAEKLEEPYKGASWNAMKNSDNEFVEYEIV